MGLFQAIFLGLLQGITEFLPISSSGHLVILESFLGLNVEELKDFDVMLHLGTLLAILIYFWRDIWQVKLWPTLILASIPATIVGIFLEDKMDALFRGPISVAIFMILVGLLFFIPQKVSNRPLNLKRGFLVGCAQAVALIPGVSRSGSTIFTGTMLGMDRKTSAKFSFLLGAIAIGGAGLLKAPELLNQELLPATILGAGFLSSFFAGILAISFLMKFLEKYSLKSFGIYRIAMGILILVMQLL